jgi:hypothetical protein
LCRNAINPLARYRRDDYLGVADLWSTTYLTGIDYAHDFGDGLIGTAELSVRQVTVPLCRMVQPWHATHKARHFHQDTLCRQANMLL